MPPLLRRFLSGLTLIGGLLVLFWELSSYRGPESWFWIALASLATMLSLADLLSRPTPME
ncbi:MAG TPA: hypothetical protein VF669_17215 [Tepidisphaeraceae bacterium]|jgi:hypothetical protein